jgi:hypothetical protein
LPLYIAAGFGDLPWCQSFRHLSHDGHTHRVE